MQVCARKDSIQITNMDESENKKNESTWSKMKGYARDTTSRVGSYFFGKKESDKDEQKEEIEETQKDEKQSPQMPLTQAQDATAVKDESAMGRLKESLHSVKVSKYDADELQRQLEGELFDKWSEGCEVMSAKQIPFDTIKEYLDHLQDAYEGIDDEIRKKLNGVLFAQTTWEYRLVEWKFNKGDDSGARYGMIAFGRSPDQKFVDCMYVLYKMDFKVAKQRIVTEKEHSWFWGLIKYKTDDVEIRDRALGSKSIQTMQNFFRIKALEGFYKEGLIESINYVNSLEDIPDLNAT